MYKLHLILKYLRKRRIAWVSLLAVMLCTALVIVVISVMGGWLEMFRERFHAMTGDVVVYREGLTGFAGYDEMISEYKKLPEVEEALPLLRTFGLLHNANNIRGVQVVGLDPGSFAGFNGFGDSLWRQSIQPKEAGKPATRPSFALIPDQVPYEQLRQNDKQALKRPGMIIGAPMAGLKKDESGKLTAEHQPFYLSLKLDVVPLSDEMGSSDSLQPNSTIYWVVDISRSQLWQIDDQTVYVPFDVLQKDLQMTPQPYTDATTGQKLFTPARCSEIQIKIKPGVDPIATRDKIRKITYAITERNDPFAIGSVKVQTWDEQQAKFLNAVEKEKVLMMFLFGMISIVAVFLIFCILYMIVVEKTRDIGIIKSVGATSQGVAAIFLGYGLAIGVSGAFLGLAIATLIIRNINEIHAWLGAQMGIVIWDPETYAFDEIPNRMDPKSVIVIMTVAILASVLGAVIPAARAASLNPVEALRFE